MRASLVLVLGGFLVAAVQATPFQDCTAFPSQWAFDLDTLDVGGCKKVPCKILLGEYVNVTAHYDRMNHSYGTLRHDGVWYINGLHIKSYLSPKTVSGTASSFSAVIQMNPDLVPIPGELYWRVFNDKDIAVLCFKVPIYVAIS